MTVYRVRFVSDGGPVRADDFRKRPATCGHKHTTLSAARECLTKSRETTCATHELGADLQLRFARFEPWQWLNEK